MCFESKIINLDFAASNLFFLILIAFPFILAENKFLWPFSEE